MHSTEMYEVTVECRENTSGLLSPQPAQRMKAQITLLHWREECRILH